MSWLTCIPCEQKVALHPYCPVGIFSKLKGLLMLFCSVYHLFNAPRHRDTASENAHWRSAVNRHTVIYMHKNTEEDMHHFCMYFCSCMHPCTEWNILYMYKQRLALKLCRQEIYYVWMPFHINTLTCWYLFIIFFIMNNDNLLFIYVGQRSGPLVCTVSSQLPCVCVDSHRVLRLSPTVQKHTFEAMMKKNELGTLNCP